MKRIIITCSVVLLGVFLSTFTLATPTPNTTDDSIFNTKIALEHIAEISEQSHSVFDPIGHEEVRQYIIGQLGEFIGNENIEEFTYLASEFDTEEDLEYDVKNVLGVIEGKSDTGILIVAHYDSRGQIGRAGELGNSYGAADDGYGLALMLEVARLYGEKELENSIYLLFTDAEETGLYGASKAAQESFMDNVGFVINLEARGIKGPAYMFETSTKNDKVIDFYANADMPVSYSLATAVYTVMPNSTDFTEFLAVDKNGVNFSVLDGLFYYHTPHDNYENVNQSSIEHYGTQIMPLIEEFTMNSEYSDVDYFDGEQDKIFFTVFKDVFIHYSETVGTVLHSILLVLIIATGVYLFMKNKIDVKKLGYSAIIIFALFVLIAIDGNIVGRIVAYYSKVPFNITYVRTTFGGLPTILTLLLWVILVGYLYHKFTTKDGIRKAIVFNGVLLNGVLALVSGLLLSGASFLFFVPALFGLVYILIDEFCKKEIVKDIVVYFIIVILLVVILPIIYSLYLALTVGGLMALGIIMIFYLLIEIPCFFTQID